MKSTQTIVEHFLYMVWILSRNGLRKNFCAIFLRKKILNSGKIKQQEASPAFLFIPFSWSRDYTSMSAELMGFMEEIDFSIDHSSHPRLRAYSLESTLSDSCSQLGPLGECKKSCYFSLDLRNFVSLYAFLLTLNCVTRSFCSLNVECRWWLISPRRIWAHNDTRDTCPLPPSLSPSIPFPASLLHL